MNTPASSANGAQPRPGGAGSDRIDPALFRMTATLIVGALAVIFDTTIMSVAIDNLAVQLHTSIDTIQWVSTGYLLSLSATMPAVGWAQSVLGGKRLWIVALGIFLVGSLLCAVAWNAPSLIAFRVFQGIGGDIMMPLMTTLIMQAAKGRNIGKVMSLITVPTALGPVIGPVIGGIILHLGDWRWIFLFNVPFCIVGAYLAARYLPEDGPRTRTPLDVVGMLLLSPGVAGVIYGLSQFGGSGGLTSLKVGLPLIVGVVLLVGYVGWALRRGSKAVLDVRLFRHRALASSSAGVFLSGAALYGTMLLLPLYWEEVRGESPLGAAAAHPAGPGHPRLPLAGRPVHGSHRAAPGRHRRLRHHLRVHRAVRLRHRLHEQHRADGGAAGARRRTGRGHDLAVRRRLHRAGPGGHPPGLQHQPRRPADRRLGGHRRPGHDPAAHLRRCPHARRPGRGIR